MSLAADELLEWYDRAQRDLPWRRRGVSAWQILVSEFMLQQTPVARVEPIWLDWVARWPTPSATAGSSGAQVEIGNTINYGSFGTTADIDCADGKSLNVGGSNNTLTIKGSCASVNIGGADNKITLDRVDDSLSVVGLNNTVTYRDGDPKVEDRGSGNTVTKG